VSVLQGSRYSLFLYDAFYALAILVDKLLASGTYSIRDGTAHLNAGRNLTFDGRLYAGSLKVTKLIPR